MGFSLRDFVDTTLNRKPRVVNVGRRPSDGTVNGALPPREDPNSSIGMPLKDYPVDDPGRVRMARAGVRIPQPEYHQPNPLISLGGLANDMRLSPIPSAGSIQGGQAANRYQIARHRRLQDAGGTDDLQLRQML